MDQSRPFILASTEPCYEANPTLWHLYCALTGRIIGQPSALWTEQDVVIAILARGLNPNDARKNDSGNEQSGSVKSGYRFDIRRDLSTGNVMAVREASSSNDAVVFVVGA